MAPKWTPLGPQMKFARTLVFKNILKLGKGIILHALYDHDDDHVDNGGDYDGDDDYNGGD